MSAALVVGHAEISQLRPHERRMAPVVETAGSPFRVIAGIHVPDPAPPRESVPSPSAAAAPAATPSAVPPVADPVDGLLEPDIPSDVPEPGALRKRLDKTVAAAPAPVRGVLAPAVDTTYQIAGSASRTLGLSEVIAPVQQAIAPPYTEVVETTQPQREAAGAVVAETWEDTTARRDGALEGR